MSKEFLVITKKQALLFIVAVLAVTFVVDALLIENYSREAFQEGYVCAFDREQYGNSNITLNDPPSEYCLIFNKRFLELYDKTVVKVFT